MKANREWIIKGLKVKAIESDKDADQINAYKALGSLVCDTERPINEITINNNIPSNYSKIAKVYDDSVSISEEGK